MQTDHLIIERVFARGDNAPTYLVTAVINGGEMIISDHGNMEEAVGEGLDWELPVVLR